jgi:hypothetical protein
MIRDEFGDLKETFIYFDSGKIKPSIWTICLMVFLYLMCGAVFGFDMEGWDAAGKGLFVICELIGAIIFVIFKSNDEEMI